MATGAWSDCHCSSRKKGRQVMIAVLNENGAECNGTYVEYRECSNDCESKIKFKFYNTKTESWTILLEN